MRTQEAKKIITQDGYHELREFYRVLLMLVRDFGEDE